MFTFARLHPFHALLACLLLAEPIHAAGDATGWQQSGDLAANEAHQAAAADGRFVYAVANSLVAKYDRETGERIAVSSGEAQHLNSGYFYDGRLYCAHSNYPKTPERSEIKVLDVDSMELSTFHEFGDHGGSLTWAVRHDGDWWGNFAYYGDDNAKTYLARFDDDWHERARWTYPPAVIARLGRYSLSGGLFRDGNLLVTGHDDGVLFRLRIPQAGDQLEWIDEQPVPFTGQGFAIDPQTGGLVGIDRAGRRIIFARRCDASAFGAARCEGAYPKHLQGVCTNDCDALYWSFTDQLVKTDLEGRVVKKIPVANHHGDLCYREGKVYVAVNLGEFNQPAGRADSWVYVYDAQTLRELARHETPEVVHGAGGIASDGEKFLVVGGLPEGVRENYLYEYDEAFTFRKRHVLASGYTRLGIQTAGFFNDQWWFGCYGSPQILLTADADLRFLDRYEFDCSLGVTGLPDGRILVAAGTCQPGVGCTGNVREARKSVEAGLIVQPDVAVGPLQLMLPPDVYGVPGVEMAIYFDNIVLTESPEDYRFHVDCDVGRSEQRRWAVVPAVEDAGDHALTVTVSDAADREVSRKSTVLHVAAAGVRGEEPIRLLLVGDSLTHASLWPNELARLLSEHGSSDWTMLGTHRPAGAADRVAHEGYSGWTWRRFAAHYEPNPDGTYRMRSSPFVFLGSDSDPVLDVERYIIEECDGSPPDVVVFLLGINDCFSADPDDPQAIDERIDAAFQHAEALLADFQKAAPEAELAVCLTTAPNTRASAFEANYQGRYHRWGWKRIQHRLVEREIARFSGRKNDRIFIVPTELNLDPTGGYPEDNSVHPNAAGYAQIAASVYAWLAARSAGR